MSNDAPATEQLLNAIRNLDAKKIARKSTTLPFFVATLIVATISLLMPLIYLGIVALVGYGTFEHAMHYEQIFSFTRSNRLNLLLYVTPILTGAVLLWFMLRPLFQIARFDFTPFVIDEKTQPVFISFVDRVCELLNAPRPGRIVLDNTVNASASFYGGFPPITLGQPQLTLGVPLIAGLSANELASVIAHEYGHFGQRGTLRLSVIIGRIEALFQRLVYDRDPLLDVLRSSGKSDFSFFGIARFLVYLLSTIMSYLVRGLLWLLMNIAELFHSFLHHQLEFDADRTAGMLVGSEITIASLEKLPALSLAGTRAIDAAEISYQDGLLCRNISELTMHCLPTLTDEEIQESRLEAEERAASLFSSHPPTSVRISALESRKLPSNFHLDGPATQLFPDFNALGTDVTSFFFALDEEPTTNNHRLADASEIFAAADKLVNEIDSARTIYGARINSRRLLGVFTPPATVPETAQDAFHAYDAAKQEIADSDATYTDTLKRLDQVEHDIWRIDTRIFALAHSLPNLSGFDKGLPNTKIDLVQLKATLQREQRQLEQRLEQLELPALNLTFYVLLLVERFHNDIGLTLTPEEREELKLSLMMLRDLDRLSAPLEKLRTHYCRGSTVASLAGWNPEKAPEFAADLLSSVSDFADGTQAFLALANQIDDRFSLRNERVSIRQSLFPEDPNPKKFLSLHDFFERMEEAIHRCAARVYARLARLAVRVEGRRGGSGEGTA